MENVTLVQKRWPVDKPSHLAVRILFYFTVEVGIWIIYSNTFQLRWHFLGRWGPRASRHRSVWRRHAETELSQFSPRSLRNKPQDFTITTRRQWESHKVTHLLFYLWRLLMQSWSSHTVHLITPLYFTTHPLCFEPEPHCERCITKAKYNHFPNVSAFCTVGSKWFGIAFKGDKFISINYFCLVWSLC